MVNYDIFPWYMYWLMAIVLLYTWNTSSRTDSKFKVINLPRSPLLGKSSSALISQTNISFFFEFSCYDSLFYSLYQCCRRTIKVWNLWDGVCIILQHNEESHIWKTSINQCIFFFIISSLQHWWAANRIFHDIKSRSIWHTVQAGMKSQSLNRFQIESYWVMNGVELF